MKVLVIEDDVKLSTLLKRGLSEEGYVVDTCEDGEYGLELAASLQYDLVILDVMLPSMDGWDILRAIRRDGINVAVIMLTARDAVEHKVKGLSAGADDYLVKPFAFAELVARIRAVLRRKSQVANEVYAFDDLYVDPMRHLARRAESQLALSPKEIKLLSLLLTHQGEVLTRSFIVDRIWDMAYDNDSNVVDVNIRRLRAKIDDPFPRKILHTIRGRGYVIR